MARFVFASLLLLAGPAAYAQQTDPNMTGAAAQTNLNALTTNAPTMVPRATRDGVKGSPYTDNRWRLAQITLSNHLPLAPVPLKYDVLSQRLLMHKPAPSPDSLQLDDRLVQQFVLLSPVGSGLPAKPQLFRRFAEAPDLAEQARYVEVLHQGQYALLKRDRRTLKPANFQGAYNNDERYDVIENKVDYFLAAAGTPAQPVKLSLKSLQQAAPALAPALKATADARAPRTEAEWAQVFDLADPATVK